MYLKILNTALLAIIYYFAYLSSATNVLGVQLKELPTHFPFDVMPSGFVFMTAWISIYVLLAAFTVWMWKKSNDTPQKYILLRWLAVTHVLHVFRLITSGQQMFVLNVLIIFGIWGVLWKMLDLLKTQGYNKNTNMGWIAIGTYYGWISIATCVLGISQLLYLWKPAITMSMTWSVIAIIVAIVVTIWSRLRWKNIYALLLCLWAIGGVLFSVFG